MRMARIFLFLAIVTLLACTVAWLSPLPAQPSPQTLNLTFTTIDVPGAGYTEVFGVNSNGDMVGNYGTNTNIDSHGFKYSNGVFSYFDYPGEPETIGTGINDSGSIVGHGTSGLFAVGFSFDGANLQPLRTAMTAQPSLRGSTMLAKSWVAPGASVLPRDLPC